MVGNYYYAFRLPTRISQKRLRNYFAIVTCDHRRRREHGHTHGGRVVAGGGDNVVLDSVADRLFVLSPGSQTSSVLIYQAPSSKLGNRAIK